MKFSVVIPVFNRAEELEELLESLAAQAYNDFEVIVVDDGSPQPCDKVVDAFRDRLRMKYYYKQNEGPGPARNLGLRNASGEYLIMFDSDCLLPPGYFEMVHAAQEKHRYDVWGGPDRERDDFTPLQRAMGITMSTFLTTGGIRGGRSRPAIFQPRSFNMGMTRSAFEKTGGFVFTRLAEDIELSIRARKAGLKVGLIQNAFVYHKRRNSLAAFFRQVYCFGQGRVRVGKTHPGEVKATHWLPVLFLLGICAMIVSPFFLSGLFVAMVTLYLAYAIAILVVSLRRSGRIVIGLLSVPAAFVQLCGYGLGFLREQFRK